MGRRLAIFCLVYASYLLSARLGLAFAADDEIVSPVWPPAGIGLCAMLLAGPRYWPAIFLASLTGNLNFLLENSTAGLPAILLQSIGIGIANALEGVLGYHLLTVLNGDQPPTRRGSSVAWVVPTGILVAAVGAAIGAIASSVTTPDGPQASVFLTWWVGDTAGILIITPLIIGWPSHWLQRTLSTRGVEGLVYIIALASSGYFLFTLPPSHPMIHSLQLLMSPVLIWSAFRYAPPVTAFASAMIGVIALWGALRGLGPLQHTSESILLTRLQIFICVNAAISIVVTASFAYQKRIAFSLKLVNDTLEKRIADRTVDLASANDALTQRVHERELAEQSLRRSEERYRDVTEAAADWLWEVDANLCITASSTGLASTLGVETKSLVGKPLLELGHPDSRWITRNTEFQRLLEAHAVFRNAHFTIAAKDDAECHLQVSGKPLLDDNGEFAGYRGSGLDITDLEKTRNLAASLGRIVNESLNEIYLLHADTLECMLANRGARRNLQYSREEFAHLSPTRFLPDFSVESLRELLAPLLAGSQDRLTLETRHERKDHSTYPVDLHLQYVDYAAEPVVLAIAVDLTEQKSLQAQLARAQKLESIGELAAGVAHEINTPTQYVSDNTRFLKDSFVDLGPVLDAASALVANEPDPQSIEALRQALDQADIEFLRTEIPTALDQSLDGLSRIAEIVRAMKEFSHPSSGEMEQANINEIISTAVTVSANEWKYVADIDSQLAADLPPIPCLRGELGQVILNMLVNAAHAIGERNTDSGEARGVIRIETTSQPGAVQIAISDTGAGIAPELLDKVFDLFFTTKAVGKGTGQGLALAHTVIVDKHGGSIHVESTPGVGTTFYITLPAAPETATISEAIA